jgi:acetylxylan esterase
MVITSTHKMSSLLLTLLCFLVHHTIATSLAERGNLVKITDVQFSDTARKTKHPEFHLYVPKSLSKEPAFMLAVHYCTGTGPRYFEGAPWAGLADKYGFIVGFPSSPHDGKCWDVSSAKTLKHGMGGDSGDLVDMVKWVLGRHPDVDKKKVFVVGESSGAMMTVSFTALVLLLCNCKGRIV